MIPTLLVGAAFACGGLVNSLDHTEQLAASDALQAIFDVGADSVSIDYRVHYTGDAEDFAWIIPVPGEVLDVAEGDDARFDTLAALTAPQVNVYETSSGDDDDGAAFCGCGGAMSKGDLAGNLSDSGGLGDGVPLDVAVIGQGYAGDYAYTVLDTEDSAAFADWLTERGYDLTYAAGPIDAYVADPIGFQWVAVQLRPSTATTPDGGVNISPLRITYGRATGDGKLHALYPSRMTATVQLNEVRTELYVIADGHAVAGNGWVTNVDMHAEGSTEADPVEVYANFLRSVGGDQRGLVEAYKGVYTDDAGDARYLTRLDGIVAPPVHTSDVSFATDDDTTDERRFYVSLGGYYYGALLPLGAFAGLVAAWSARRRG